MEANIEKVLSEMGHLFHISKVTLDNMEEVIGINKMIIRYNLNMSDTMLDDLDLSLDHSIEVLCELKCLIDRLTKLLHKLKRGDDHNDLDEMVGELTVVQSKLAHNIEESSVIVKNVKQFAELFDLMNCLRNCGENESLIAGQTHTVTSNSTRHQVHMTRHLAPAKNNDSENYK